VSLDAWHDDVPPCPVPHPAQLRLLVADAAGRAVAMLAVAHAPAEDDDPLADAVRILATAEGSSHTAQSAHLTGLPEEELRRLVLAYRHGGSCGVSATVGATAGGADQTADAVREVRRQRALAIGDLETGPGTIIDTGAGVRIRLGPDGRWYPFTSGRDRWWPAPGAAGSPGAAWQAALRARSLRRAGG
jgi:hypothetical protein